MFGSNKPDGNDEAMKKMGEQMQKLSETIGTLQKELAQKTAEADQLRAQAAQNAGSQTALEDANAQMEVLRNQINDLQSKAQQQAAGATAAAAASASSATQRVLGAETSAGGLAVGGTAYVTSAGGKSLRLRSGPSLNESILGGLPPRTSMTLLDGPQQADGHAWWHIRTSDGREGWVAGEDLRTQPD